MSAATPSLRLPPGTLGAAVGPIEQTIDARWLMAYAAALGETDARYFDTAAATGPSAHPLFCVCLHGTATLALAVSLVVARELGGHPGLVRRVAVRFTDMVPMPSFVTVRAWESQTADLHFDAVDAAGRPVLGRGVVTR